MKYLIPLILVMGFLLFSQSSADTQYSEESTLIQTAQTVIQSTVKITSPNLTHGSGFYISANEILTNAHVINGQIMIRTYDKRSCKAQLKYMETGVDLALLTTDCTGTPLKLTESYTVGQTVLAVGNPDIYEFMTTQGIVSGEGWQHILFDAPITFGSSGGALVDIQGKVIGVVKASDDSLGFVGFAITGKEVNRFLERAR